MQRDSVSGISAAVPEDTPAVRQFLASVFDADLEAPSLAADLMDWKYHVSHPEWSGSRAFLLRKNGRVAAHVGIVPVTWLTPDGSIPCVVPIDWAADPLVPGAGAVLYRKLNADAGVVLQIGGTDQARKMVELLGRPRCGSLDFYVHVVRPWRQHRLRPTRDWKSPMRLARNSIWNLSPLARVPAGWKAEPVSAFNDSMLPPVTREMQAALTLPVRSAAFLNYMLRCPAARFQGYRLLANGKSRGFFLLSSVGPQTRIADVFVSSLDPAEWTVAYALAGRAAGQRPHTCEIAAVGSTPLARQALTANAFRRRGCDPAWIFDPDQFLDPAIPLRLTMLESDSSYLYNPQDPFLS